MKLSTFLLDLFFPPRCTFCHALVENGEIRVCDRCKKDLPQTRPGSVLKKDFVKAVAAPFYYENEVRESLLRYKFGNMAGYADVYAAYVASCIRESLPDDWDVISWVPVSKKRLRERGYDQAELLCRAVAKNLGKEPTRVLDKHRHTKAQSATGSAEKRKANIAGAYRLCGGVDVRDKRILLLDDIVTTGATVSECARTLGMAGAACVYCAAVARQRD